MLFSRFQSPFEIKAHLWQKLADDWTIAGRDWVHIDMVVNRGTSIELRLLFWDEDGADSNVFNPPTSCNILSNVWRYLRPCNAYLYRPWTDIASALKTDCETRPAGTLRLRPACSTLILIPAIGLRLSAAATFRVGGTVQTSLD